MLNSRRAKWGKHVNALKGRIKNGAEAACNPYYQSPLFLIDFLRFILYI